MRFRASPRSGYTCGEQATGHASGRRGGRRYETNESFVHEKLFLLLILFCLVILSLKGEIGRVADDNVRWPFTAVVSYFLGFWSGKWSVGAGGEEEWLEPTGFPLCIVGC